LAVRVVKNDHRWFVCLGAALLDAFNAQLPVSHTPTHASRPAIDPWCLTLIGPATLPKATTEIWRAICV
jgi:hypothetical protein